MKRNFDLRSVGIRMTSGFLISLSILGTIAFAPAPTAIPFSGVQTVQAASKDTVLNEKLYKLIPRVYLDFMPYLKQSTTEPLYSDVMTNPYVIDIFNARKDDFAKLSAETFTDVAGEWFEHLMPLAVYTGLINGYEDGTFKGNNPVKKGEFVTMVARNNYNETNINNGKVGADKTGIHLDTFGPSEKAWWIGAYGLCRGLPSTWNVKPSDNWGDSPMTRAQAARTIAILVEPSGIRDGNYLEKAKTDFTAFPDIKKLNDDVSDDALNVRREAEGRSLNTFALLEEANKHPERGVKVEEYAAMLYLKDMGIMEGDDNGNSNWSDAISRAEVVALLTRVNMLLGETRNR